MLFESQIKSLLQRLPYWRRKKQKNTLRRQLEMKRRTMPKEEAESLSVAVVSHLKSVPEFYEGHKIMLYYPIRNEVDVIPLLEAYQDSKVLLLPVVLHGHKMELRQYKGAESLKKGSYGIPEPIGERYSGHIDTIIVPGVGFDRQLHRIGRGGGYYDRFLKKHPEAKKVAVAYDFQIVDHVPVGFFDQKVDAIITPTTIIR